jgi:hypothetical protein
VSKRQQDSRARRSGDAAAAATSTAAVAAGTAAARAAEAVQRAGSALEHRGTASAPAVGSAVGQAVDAAVEGAGTARTVAERIGGAALGAAGGLVSTVHGIVEEPTVRGGAALDALRGVPVGPPAARRRWPWAVGAALTGAAAGAVVAALIRRLSTTDAPGAQEPHELRAVVDVAGDPATPAAAAGPGTTASTGLTPAKAPGTAAPGGVVPPTPA